MNDIKSAIKKLDGGNVLLAERTQEIEQNIEELESDIDLIPSRNPTPGSKA